MVVDVDIGLEHRVQIVRRHHPRHRRPQRVANEVQQVVIFNQFGVLGKNRALLRILHVFFELGHAALPREAEDVVQHLQTLQIKLFRILAARKNPEHALEDLDHQRQRIGNQQRADRGPADDHQFGRLNQHRERPLFHQEAADNGAEDHDDPNNCEHVPVIYRPSFTRTSAPRERFRGSISESGSDGSPSRRYKPPRPHPRTRHAVSPASPSSDPRPDHPPAPPCPPPW